MVLGDDLAGSALDEVKDGPGPDAEASHVAARDKLEKVEGFDTA